MENWTQPTIGDIVWCHFPYLPCRDPGPKPRPALVVNVIEYEDGVAVIVVYGTSKGVQKLYAGEFAITAVGTTAAYKSAGLCYDTKFDFNRSIELPWNQDFFGVPARAAHGRHPKLGELHFSVMRAAKAAYQAAPGNG
jgi:mRNA-degrading endonuclease toxin of MazEF toxin-antitoxin module